MIHVRSELGKGTSVEVSLPLEKSEPGNNCSSILRSDIDVHGSLEAQQCVENVRKIAQGKTVAIIRDNANATDGQAFLDPIWQCLKNYFSAWLGFTIIDNEDRGKLASVDIVVGEKDGNYLMTNLTVDMDFYRILLIRDGMSCVLDRTSCSEKATVETIWSPIGPYKLARAVLGLFKDQPGAKARFPDSSLQAPFQNNEQASMSTLLPRSLTPVSSVKESRSDYSNATQMETKRIPEYLPNRPAADVIKPEVLQIPDATNKISTIGDQGAAQALRDMQLLPVPTPEVVSPDSPTQMFAPDVLSPQIEEETSLRVLAVDDNMLNLQLLHRYLIRRPKDIVVTARNGVEAVAAVRQAKIPFDIILMDLSMPDMDGFEATRLIRVFERSMEHREASEIEERSLANEHTIASESGERDFEVKVNEVEIPAVPRQIHAYIVALTGLASRRDRDEAEESGFDDFLTKPISFTKIGDLLTRKSVEKGRREQSTKYS
jgi:CheY-like chemotaxis protein